MADTPAPASSTRRVLLVEAHNILARQLHQILAATPGPIVVTDVTNGQDALVAATAWQPDLVVLALHLPDACGLEVAVALQKASSSVKIILLIDEDDVRYHQAAWLSGVTACVAKERVASDLATVVCQVLRSQPVQTPTLDEHQPSAAH